MNTSASSRGYIIAFQLLLVGLSTASCDKLSETAAPAQTVNSNVTSATKYLVFADRTEFEETIHSLDNLIAGETIDGHLAKWEEQHGGFYSLRKKYADAYAQGDSSSCPVEDDYFATLLSPDGTIQIGNNIYRIDFLNKKNILYTS